jgi:hypothetical protein
MALKQGLFKNFQKVINFSIKIETGFIFFPIFLPLFWNLHFVGYKIEERAQNGIRHDNVISSIT